MPRAEPGRMPHTTPRTRSPALVDAVSRVAAAPVPAVARHGGEPLDEPTRMLAEHQLGHEFSRVRVHRDAEAARAADQLGARAFTVASSIAFAPGEYRPRTTDGLALVLHELTHVVEQAGALPTVQYGVKPEELPGFSQGQYITCGAASLVTALVIWDRERHDPTSPNTTVVAACDIALVYMDDHRTALTKAWDAAHTGKGTALYEAAVESLTLIRDDARLPGAKITQEQYEQIGVVFYGLYVGGASGLPKEARESLLKMLGLFTGQSDEITSFDQIFTVPAITNLQPGRIAQVTWYVLRGPANEQNKTPLGMHAFLIGRFKDRSSWFLSDQGTTPALELEAPSLVSLKQQMLATKRYWTGAPPATYYFGQPLPMREDATQVLVLGERSGVETQAKTVALKPGDFLAEVDAGYVFVEGEQIRAGAFVARAYSETDGLRALQAIPVGQGGVMVENPEGLFHVYETTTVSEANLNVTEIDEADSAGGKLEKGARRFYQAWLRLCTPTECNPTPLKVY